MHYPLEEGWRIRQAKVHNLRNIGAEVGFEGCLVFVLFLQTDIIVSPSYIEFRKEALSPEIF